MEYTIYKIRNKLNDKIYIGRTSDYKTRILQHLYGSKSDLQKDMKTYGKENFECSIVENVLEAEQSKKIEGYWIDYYKSIGIIYNKVNSGAYVGLKMRIISVKMDDHIIQDLKNMIPILMDEIGVPVTFSDVIRWACRDYVKNKGGKK